MNGRENLLINELISVQEGRFNEAYKETILGFESSRSNKSQWNKNIFLWEIGKSQSKETSI